MSHLFITSDLHLGHANICLYCDRPFVRPEWVTDTDGKVWWVSPDAAMECAEYMTQRLISNMNARIKDGDTVIHVGDFCTWKAANGVPGMCHKPEYYEEQLNGKWIFIRGNHDRNNRLKYGIDSMDMELGKKRVHIRHHPVYDQCAVTEDVDMIVCGHVHTAWKHAWVGDVPNINMCVEQWGYMPVRLDELLGYYEKSKRTLEERGEPK